MGKMCSSSSSGNEKDNKSDTSKNVVDSLKKEVSNWEKDTIYNKMAGTKTFIISTRSTNSLIFKFPYDGGSYVDLMIRYKNNSNEIMLSINKGQFIGESIHVKFDNDKQEEYSLSKTTDGSSDVVFLESSKKFINRLKTAKKLMIQAEFFQEGQNIIEFDVEGFKWSH